MADQEVKLKVGLEVKKPNLSETQKAFEDLVKNTQAQLDKLKLSPAASQAASGGSIARDNNRRAAEVEAKQHKDNLKSVGDYLRILEQIGREKEKQSRQEHIAQVRSTGLAQIAAAGGGGRGMIPYGGMVPYGAGGGGGSTGGGSARFNPFGVPGFTTGALGALGMAADYIGRRPIDIARMQGSATSMTTGRQLSEARSGEYTYESMYGGDRKKAQETAETSRKWGTVADYAMGALSAAAVVAAPFTGGLSGLALAGVGAAGLKSAIFDKGILDPQKYAAYSGEQKAQDFTTMLASLHEMGPYRKDAIERLKATGERDLNMERRLGLKDFGPDGKTGGYLGAGGYLQSQMDLGFTDEMVVNSSKGILGAGGSTAMAQQSGISLQAQRGLGLTNADQLLGQLSGTQSIPETSKESLIDIFARGFDASKYAEENMKYMQAVTEQVYKGGTTSTESTDRVADLIRAAIGTGAPTTRKIEAGQSAFEAYKAASSSTSGYLGGINYTTALQDPYLKQLGDPAAISEIIKESAEGFDGTDTAVIELAKKTGFPGGGKEMAAYLNKLFGKQTLEKAINRPKGSLEFGRRNMIRESEGLTNTPAVKAAQDLLDAPEGSEQNDKWFYAGAKQAAARDMANKNTGKAGDTAVQSSAMNAEISLQTLSDSINKFAADAMDAAKKLSGEAAAGRADEKSKNANDSSWGANYPGSILNRSVDSISRLFHPKNQVTGK